MSTTQSDHRLSLRREILNKFETYLTVPHLGEQKLPVHDMNLKGLSFFLKEGMTLRSEESFNAFLHITPVIRVPLLLKAVHILSDKSGVRAGCDLTGSSPEALAVHENLIALLESLIHFADI
jgi:hypothetical protein